MHIRLRSWIYIQKLYNFFSLIFEDISHDTPRKIPISRNTCTHLHVPHVNELRIISSRPNQIIFQIWELQLKHLSQKFLFYILIHFYLITEGLVVCVQHINTP